jgi:hypothetical protein
MPSRLKAGRYGGTSWRGRPYRATDANLRTPWTHLLRSVPDFRWHTVYAGTGYIGSGTVR